MKKIKFNIGDRVYHATPESPHGMVIDCQYSLRHNEWSYLVVFDYEHESLLYQEDELSFDKTIL